MKDIDAEHLQFLLALRVLSLDWIVLDDSKKADRRASSVGLPKEMLRMQREAKRAAERANVEWPVKELGDCPDLAAWDRLSDKQRWDKITNELRKSRFTVKWPEDELGAFPGPVAWDGLNDRQRGDKITDVRKKLRKTF
eukprot:COSAG06_NODE_316_length_17668_cov_19.142410_12_plen_139_part_00